MRGQRPEQRDGLIARLVLAGVLGARAVARAAGVDAAVGAAGPVGRAFGAMPVNRARLAGAAERAMVAMPELDAADSRGLVLRSYGHLARLAAEMALMDRIAGARRWAARVSLGDVEPALRPLLRGDPVVLITGHVGNWEVLGATMAGLGVPMHALYRPLDLKPLDDWVRRTRSRMGIDLVDKFGAAERLPGLIDAGEPVAFVADQNAGRRGVYVPFFGRLASTYKTIGLLAARHGATVVCAAAFRERGSTAGGPGGRRVSYRIEITDAFGPGDYAAQPDPVYYITARYRRAIEAMVRRAPEQYLWMHRAWKTRPVHERNGEPFPDRLRGKLAALPWMTEDALAGVIDRSARDSAWMRQRRVRKLG